MADGLVSAPQASFAAGMWRATSRHLMDRRSAYLLRNLLLDDDGAAYLRGGAEWWSGLTDGTGLGTGLTWVWNGFLGPGERTLVASAGTLAVVSADGATFATIDGHGVNAPPSHAVVGGILFIGRAEGAKLYAGSRMTASYTASVTVRNGSPVVSGSGLSVVDAGALLRVDGGRAYVVKSVQSAAQVTLAEAYKEGDRTVAGTFSAVADAGSLYRSGELYAVVADRLIALSKDTIAFSAGRNDDTGDPRPFLFQENAYQRITDGGVLLGGADLRGVLLAFATNGIWGVYNLDRDLIDAAGNPQQRVERISHDLILWGHAGIAGRDNALVVPCTDGVWLMDGASAPERLTRSITPLYIDYVRRGYRPGQAQVFRGHYVLPIVDVGGAVRDTLVCRLDRALSTDIGTVYPWTSMRGTGANAGALAVRGQALELLGADAGAGDGHARVMNLAPWFGADRRNRTDPDGSNVDMALTVRDEATGAGNANLVRALELDYELEAASNGGIAARYSNRMPVNAVPHWGAVTWGAFVWTAADDEEFTTLPDAAPGEPTHPMRWRFNRRGRYIRYELAASEACAKLRLRSFRSRIRPSAKDR